MSCPTVCPCPALPRIALTQRTAVEGDANAGVGSSRAFRGIREVRLRRIALPIVGVGTTPYVMVRLATQANDDQLAPNAEGPHAYSMVVSLKKQFAGDEVGVLIGCDQVLWRSGQPEDFGGPAFWRWEVRLPNGTPYNAPGASAFLFELELTPAGRGCCAH